jgi:hypothetical protein
MVMCSISKGSRNDPPLIQAKKWGFLDGIGRGDPAGIIRRVMRKYRKGAPAPTCVQPLQRL